MTKEMQARIKDLDTRLDSAVVELVSEADKIYNVFVPGAHRENNRVKAESESEAVQKVKEVIISKMQAREDKNVSAGAKSEGTLEVQKPQHDNSSDEVKTEGAK